jgi:RNA polymerase sigma-70 factor (ECF subfamily)
VGALDVPRSFELDPDYALVSAARAGDQGAFRILFDRHRRAIHVHCYRLLGSLHDAEDLTQETFLRAWRRLSTFQGRASLRSWLYRIATNACLDALERQPKRVLPPAVVDADDPSRAPRGPVTEVAWLEPYPDVLLDERQETAPDPGAALVARETMELAFLAAIQHLPARQRAVLILRDVVRLSAREVSELLDSTVPAVNGALKRARATLRSELPESHLDLSSSRARDEEEQTLLFRYVRAWEEADIDSLLALLKEEATFSMPPSPSWYAGRDAIRVFLATSVFGPGGYHAIRGETKLLPTRANKQPAVAVYTWTTEDEAFRPQAIMVLSLTDGLIDAIVGFTDTSLFEAFELPPALGRESASVGEILEQV